MCTFEGGAVPQIGINLNVLAPGEGMSMYHWEADQEDFLVLSGEALLIIEGEERRSASGTSSTARPGEAHDRRRRRRPCAVLAIGAHALDRHEWGSYTVEPAAARHGSASSRRPAT